MNSYSRVYAAIDLDAVESNMRAMKDSLPPSTSMIGVVKADGYGHGAVPVARTIEPRPWSMQAVTASPVC